MKACAYPFQTTIEITFRDIDAFGHVNNAVYLSYMEHARINLSKLYAGKIELYQIPWIVGTTTIRYLSPARLGETLLVGMGVSRFGTKSFDLAYQIDTADEAQRAVATASCTIVHYDHATQQTTPISADFRAKINEYQADWQL